MFLWGGFGWLDGLVFWIFVVSGWLLRTDLTWCRSVLSFWCLLFVYLALRMDVWSHWVQHGSTCKSYVATSKKKQTSRVLAIHDVYKKHKGTCVCVTVSQNKGLISLESVLKKAWTKPIRFISHMLLRPWTNNMFFGVHRLKRTITEPLSRWCSRRPLQRMPCRQLNWAERSGSSSVSQGF